MNTRRIIIVFLAFCAVFVAPLCALAAPDINQKSPLAVNIDGLNPAGDYVVYVLKDDLWQEAGKLSFDKYFRQKEMDLSKYVSGDENVRIRLAQKGGGAAHIDAVLLGDRSPTEVKGVEDILALKKVSKKDFDVVDAFEKSIELTFPASRTGKVLSLTARVEGTRISEIPFQFPLSNVYKKMTANSEFYHYRLAGTPRGNDTSFFKEYCVTGSGHPSGYTYGWVDNDNQNLYVRIDFTPDDTMDGDKDYAKVYVKTEEGIREFKESVPETKWGSPDFTYTDKVEYQHKVYDFTIPLKDVGVKDIREGKELLLAFAAYGTATPTPLTKAVSCAPQTGICDDSLTYGPSASGAQGASCPNFCYKIRVSNVGGETLNNVTINDPDLPGLTIPTVLAVGQSVTLFASKTWCTADSPHVNTVTVNGVGASSGTPVSYQAGATVTVGTLSLDASITLTSAADLDGVPNDNHVTLPGGSTDTPVTVAVTLTNSGDADQNVSITLPGLVSCSDLVTPVTIPSPIAFITSGGTVTTPVGCLLSSCPAGTNLTATAVGSAVASTQLPCVDDNTGTPVTVTTTFGGQVSCQPLEPRCRTAGFWQTHAGTECPKKQPNCGSQNITQAVIDACGECIEICGEVIKTTGFDDADSAVEAMCLPVKSNIQLQLARQLTALSLNCCISGFGSDCSEYPAWGFIFSGCNTACANHSTAGYQSCINALDCLNNGRDLVSIDPVTCGPPLEDSCAIQPLCNETMDLCFNAKQEKIAGSANACNMANKSVCTIIPPGEAQCASGTKEDSECCGVCGDGECNSCEDESSCPDDCLVCDVGETNCSGTCVNTQTDNSNCGSCGNSCTGGETCVSGQCACPAGETNCSGTCVNTQTDNSNCGSCGTGCTGGYNCCSGTCVNLSTNNSHCGSCTTECSFNIPDCCNGSCTDLQGDNNNCGSCGNGCYGEDCCEGKCTDTSTDNSNCGSCGNDCYGEDCLNGQCVST